MIRAGKVYVTAHRDTCIVLWTKNNHVEFVTKRKGFVDIESCSASKFARDWPVCLDNYPVLRAIRMYIDSDLRKEPLAVASLRTLRARM